VIRAYLHELEALLASRPWAAAIEVVRCDITELDDLAILLYRFRMRLTDNGLLEMMERIVAEGNMPLRYTCYRFHWQDSGGHLVRRWDNAPHYPSLPNFPHHVHCGSETQVVAAEALTGIDLLREMDHALRGKRDALK